MATLPLPQAKCAQAFLLKPAPFCKLVAVLSSTNKSATSRLLKLRSDPNTLFAYPFFLLFHTLWQGLSLHFFFTIRLQWAPRLSFLLGSDAVKELARYDVQLLPSAVNCTLFFSYLSRPFFSDWSRTVSSKSFDT